jgi:predicted TIM-barrel fold metal-dependent hydrolase
VLNKRRRQEVSTVVKRTRRIWAIVGLLVAVVGLAAATSSREARNDRDERPAPASPQDAARDYLSVDPENIGTAVYVGDEMILDYRPQPALSVEQTRVEQAKFPAVDVHCHWTLEQDPQAMLQAMDRRNITRAVNLSGGWGDKLDRMLERFRDADPERFLIFCNIDWSLIDEPDFGERMVAFLEEARSKGVAGLKIFKDLGLRVRDASGELVSIDDPRLDPIWETCGRLGMPILIHSADPVAFFQPIDRNNERWMQLKRHPSWSFYGEEFPSREAVLAQRNRAMKRHPETTFILPHMGGNAEDLAAAGRVLDEHPNAYMDISGRVGEIGRQPYTARRFLIKYQDRMLFGTDRYPGRPTQPRYGIYYRFLETDDEYFKYYDHSFPPAGDWRIYGVFLPDEVLRKMYHENAARIFGPYVRQRN